MTCPYNQQARLWIHNDALPLTCLEKEISAGFRVSSVQVSKAVKLKKAKTIIVAPNIEQIESEGGLDDLLTEIIEQAEGTEIPVVFALSRKKLGQVTFPFKWGTTQDPSFAVLQLKQPWLFTPMWEKPSSFLDPYRRKATQLAYIVLVIKQYDPSVNFQCLVEVRLCVWLAGFWLSKENERDRDLGLQWGRGFIQRDEPSGPGWA